MQELEDYPKPLPSGVSEHFGFPVSYEFIFLSMMHSYNLDNCTYCIVKSLRLCKLNTTAAAKRAMKAKPFVPGSHFYATIDRLTLLLFFLLYMINCSFACTLGRSWLSQHRNENNPNCQRKKKQKKQKNVCISPGLEGTDRVDLCYTHNGSQSFQSRAATLAHLHTKNIVYSYIANVTIRYCIQGSRQEVLLRPLLTWAGVDSPLHSHKPLPASLQTWHLWFS